MKAKKYFMENLTTGETFQTNNEAVAWQHFNNCMFPCELFDNGMIMAEKDFEENEITGEVVLVDTNYTGEEYADINDLEEVEV